MKLLAYTLVIVSIIAAAEGKAMGGNGDIFSGWECVLERDHLPPLDPEADKLFQEARTLQKSTTKFTSGEEEHIFTLYTQAARQGHWKAMQNLANCYIKGFGTQKNYEEADKIFDAMIAKGIPSGYYGKYVMLDNGWTSGGNATATEFLHKAADAGYPLAQHKLGYYYTYPQHNSERGLRYFVCALRQGYAGSAKEIGFFLETEENYVMAVEYYYRAVSLGDDSTALKLEMIFSDRNSYNNYEPKYTLGFTTDENMAKIFSDYCTVLETHPGTRIPNIFKDHPIPDNPLMSKTASRNHSSKLKNAFGGRWPDEIFPELAPGYMPPEY